MPWQALRHNIELTKQQLIAWLMNIESSYMDPSLKHQSIFHVFSTQNNPFQQNQIQIEQESQPSITPGSVQLEATLTIKRIVLKFIRAGQQRLRREEMPMQWQLVSERVSELALSHAYK